MPGRRPAAGPRPSVGAAGPKTGRSSTRDATAAAVCEALGPERGSEPNMESRLGMSQLIRPGQSTSRRRRNRSHVAGPRVKAVVSSGVQCVTAWDEVQARRPRTGRRSLPPGRSRRDRVAGSGSCGSSRAGASAALLEAAPFRPKAGVIPALLASGQTAARGSYFDPNRDSRGSGEREERRCRSIYRGSATRRRLGRG